MHLGRLMNGKRPNSHTIENPDENARLTPAKNETPRFLEEKKELHFLPSFTLLFFFSSKRIYILEKGTCIIVSTFPPLLYTLSRHQCFFFLSFSFSTNSIGGYIIHEKEHQSTTFMNVGRTSSPSRPKDRERPESSSAEYSRAQKQNPHDDAAEAAAVVQR